MAGAEAIGLLLLAWTMGAALFLGLGLLVSRPATPGAAGFFTTLWTGLAAALGILQVWHLAWPVDGAARAALGLLAAAGLLRGRRQWRAWWPGLRPSPALGALVLAACVFVAGRSLGPPLGSDSGGYHLASVRWTAEHPLVPGLGNLHSRLGFPSSHFLYVALLDGGPLKWRSHHVASGLLLALLLAQLLIQGARTWKRPRTADLAAALLVVPTLAQALGPSASSPSPDLAVFVLGVVLGLALLDLCEPREGAPARAEVLGLVALAAALVTVKLSALGLAAAAVAVSLYLAPRDLSRRRLGLEAAAVSALFLLPWMARNVVLTGYPAYPLPWPAMPVPWRMAGAEVAAAGDWIRSWARGPGLPKDQVLAGSAWIGPWARALMANRVWVQAPLGLLAASAVALVVAGRRAGALLPALLAPLAGLVYWLATAPDVRFLGASLWLLAAFASAAAAVAVGRPWASRAVLAVSVLLALGVLAGAARRGDLLLAPDPVRGFHPTPSARVTSIETRHGLVLLVPQPGSQCWYAPLPCTPEVRPDLRLRRPGDLDAGFVLER